MSVRTVDRDTYGCKIVMPTLLKIYTRVKIYVEWEEEGSTNREGHQAFLTLWALTRPVIIGSTKVIESASLFDRRR